MVDSPSFPGPQLQPEPRERQRRPSVSPESGTMLGGPGEPLGRGRVTPAGGWGSAEELWDSSAWSLPMADFASTSTKGGEAALPRNRASPHTVHRRHYCAALRPHCVDCCPSIDPKTSRKIPKSTEMDAPTPTPSPTPLGLNGETIGRPLPQESQ